MEGQGRSRKVMEGHGRSFPITILIFQVRKDMCGVVSAPVPSDIVQSSKTYLPNRGDLESKVWT